MRFTEETYTEHLATFVFNFVNIPEEKILARTSEAQSVYIKILLAATLDENFPAEKYLHKEILDCLAKIVMTNSIKQIKDLKLLLEEKVILI
jgi:hypothetical protein